MKLLVKAGVLALLAAGCAAENGLRVTDAVDEKLSQPQKILEVDVTIDNGHVDVDVYEADRCTSIIVGAKAGSEGPMTTHTADCMNCDFRLAKVVQTPHSMVATHLVFPLTPHSSITS